MYRYAQWTACWDSNPRPGACYLRTLPTELSSSHVFLGYGFVLFFKIFLDSMLAQACDLSSLGNRDKSISGLEPVWAAW